MSWEPPEINVEEGLVQLVGSRSQNTEFVIGSTEVTYSVISVADNVNLTACSFTVRIYGLYKICVLVLIFVKQSVNMHFTFSNNSK